jgi:fimbrial chaperone protein
MKNCSLIKQFLKIGNLTCAALLSLALLPPVSHAGEWQVVPIRLDLGAGAKSGVLTVKNKSDETLNIQLKAYEWSQDSDGKDKYQDTSDLIFMPKIATLEKQGEQVVRVGIKIPATTREKTYRLFIEEIPKPRKAENSSIAIAIRFGVPIFVKPLKEEVRGDIEKFEAVKGELSAAVTNSGTAHFNITSVNFRLRNAKGDELFSKENKGWYLLSGVSRRYSTVFPADLCKDAAVAEIDVKGDRLDLKKRVELNVTNCRP